MKAHWTERLLWWVCEKLGHFASDGWDYEGQHHFECKLCKRIISKPLEAKP